MGLFFILFKCISNKPLTNVTKSFILDAAGFVFCLIFLFFTTWKIGQQKRAHAPFFVVLSTWRIRNSFNAPFNGAAPWNGGIIMNYYGMLLQVIIILSLRNVLVCLNQINHWNKPTQYKKQIKQKIFFDVSLSFFCYRTPCITPQLCHSEREKSVGRWHDKWVLKRVPIRGRRLRKQKIITLRRKML